MRESPRRQLEDAVELKKLFDHPSWQVLMERKYEELAQLLYTWAKSPSESLSWHSHYQGQIRRCLDEIALQTAMDKVLEETDPRQLEPEDEGRRVWPWLHGFTAFLRRFRPQR